MTVTIFLRTRKMKKSQFDMLIYNLREALSVLPETIPVADNDKIESIIKEKQPLLEFDESTHGNQMLHEHFLKNRDLKWIWCHHGDRYGVDPKELYKKSPDRCPIYGTLLDYGLGKNTSTHHPMYRPSQDHIKQQSRGGVKRGNIDNFDVVSILANRLRNDSTLMQQLYLLRYELKKMTSSIF
jgi:hypothetical protein